MMKLMCKLSLIWLVMATAATAQNNPTPVLDISGQPLRPGVEYYIRPAFTDMGGALTMVERNGSYCPKYVGQERVSLNRLPVTFDLYNKSQEVVLEGKNFIATFSAVTTCGGSTAWTVGERVTGMRNRLIKTGVNDASYFLIGRDQRFGGNGVNIYNLGFCPVEICPLCRFECGTFEPLLIENGVRLMSLGIGTPLAVEFERAK